MSDSEFTPELQTVIQSIAAAVSQPPAWRVNMIYAALRQSHYPSLPDDVCTAPEYAQHISQIFDRAWNMKPEIVDAVNELASAISQANESRSNAEDGEHGSKRKRTDSASEPQGADASKRQRSEVPPPDTHTLEGLEAVLQPVLDEVASMIEAFCSKEHPLAMWEPNEASWKDYPEAYEYIKNLNIPAVPASTDEVTLADLLLYNVGSLENFDEEFNTDFRDRMHEILESNSHRALADVSGAGKTRMLFEILAKSWGFYFTGATHKVKNPYGSSDIQTAVNSLAGASLPDGTRFAWQLPLGRDKRTLSIYAQSHAAANWKIAHAVFSRVLLARILIFDIFRARFSSSDKRGPLLWLLFQVASEHDKDIFTSVFSSLETISASDVQKQIADRMKRWPEGLVPRVAVDEVQVLVSSETACRFAFASSAQTDPDDGTEFRLPRPVYKAVVQTIWVYFEENSPTSRLLFAGTRFCYEEARDALSGDAKGFELDKFAISSGLFDVEEIKTYMAHFLTRRVVDEIDANVFKDIVFWLSGRHRFIAYLVQWVLQLGPGSVKQILHSMLHCLVGHSLYDDVEAIAAIRIKPLLSQTLLSAPKHPDKDYTAALIKAVEAVLELLIDGRYTYIGAEHIKLVELGIGKFSTSVNNFQIRENLVLVCLMGWLSNPNSPMSISQALNAGLERSTGDERGLPWEKATTFVLSRRLCQPGCTLGSLVTFHMPFKDPLPVWASYTCRLISHFDADGNPVLQKSEFTTSIATKGTGRKSTIEWLKGNMRCPFFKPDRDMGPDVCCYVLLTPTTPGDPSLVLLLCVQCKTGESSLQGFSLKDGIYSVSPEHFYAATSGDRAAEDRAELLGLLPPAWDGFVSSRPESSHDAEEYTPTSSNARNKKEDKIKYLSESPRYAILRVIGSLPEKVPMGRVNYGNVGRYPLAQMKREAYADAEVSMNLVGFRRALEFDAETTATNAAKEIPTPRRVTRSKAV